MEILVTGAAGFIGYHVSKGLLEKGYRVIGIDNLNAYYEVQLKQSRVEMLKKQDNFIFYPDTICNESVLDDIFTNYNINIVIHLAAQAGVRYSIENPHAYIDSNIKGFMNVLEACRTYPVEHLIYASSSSVYGANSKVPFSISDNVDHPVSLYAATKKSNELMAHTYSHLYQIPTTGLRFFTVYGPWGRPDMAYYMFTKNIIEGKPIQVFNQGDMKRDFTYVDDIIEGIVLLMNHTPETNYNSSNLAIRNTPYQLFNIGNNRPIPLMDFIRKIEELIGKKAIIEYLPMQPGDVKETFADITSLNEAIGFSPSTPIEVGLEQFVNWYRSFYHH
ncbi:NAD-dependent epimerase [Ornithinibacillus xuwenensis]|uniref:NAD-dependent epimerase n=1 Tax=Ornithinibacillus xuwenensis TaxID=3144668 RepID=A0ABU9XEI2_9BACI